MDTQEIQLNSAGHALNTAAQMLSDTVLEQAVLGAILLEEDAANMAASILRGNKLIFHRIHHQLVYASISDMQEQHLAIDLISVVQHMRKAGTLQKVGGMAFLAELTERVQGAASFQTHCYFLLELYVKRCLYSLCVDTIQQSQTFGSDSHEMLAAIQQNLNNIHSALQLRKPEKVGVTYDSVVDKIVLASETKGGITGVPTGLLSLDKITGGWQPGNLIIIAARPGMGKTSFMLAVAKNAAEMGHPGLFASLEMSNDELVTKLIAMELRYTTSQLTRGVGMDSNEAESIRWRGAKVREAGLIIDDTPALLLAELRAKAAKAVKEHGIKWIMVDYLQLMRGDAKGNREQEIGSISRGLKLLAKELRLPVIAAAQLSRAVETRGGDSVPKLSDLRESGSIEMDADLVIFPYRPEYYNITQDEFGNPTADVTHLIVAKHRNGALATATVRSIMKYSMYYDLDQFEQEPISTPIAEIVNPVRSLPQSTFDSEPAF